ncbi:MAG: M28 family peptidase [Gemmatimonadota bacterium]
MVPALAGAQEIDTLAIRAHTRFLADDLLAGRGTGTAGERLAADYIQAQLKRIGLRPAGPDSSYLLPVPLRSVSIEPETSVTLTATAGSVTFVTGRHFIVNTGGRGAIADFAGRAVFLGQPTHAAGLLDGRTPVRDRVAVFLGPLGADALAVIPALIRLGATGVILLVPDSAQFDLYVRGRGDRRFFVDADVNDPVWQPSLPVIIAGPPMTEALLAHATLPPSLIEGTADAGVELDLEVRVAIDARVDTVHSANVAGYIEGTDPSLRHQFVVFTAHYDHLGVSVPDAAGDSIYNGFSDNAAGVAMLLAIAAGMADQPAARPVAFLFFTGEERGLLGSTHAAAAPPPWLQLDSLAALINLDAGAPPAPPVSWRIAGGVGSAFGELAREVAAAEGWEATLSPASPNSDYWPFLQRGVPSIFIIPGDSWEDTSAAERDALRRRWDRYHRADDHWHPDFPFSGLARYADIARLIGRRVADRPAAAADLRLP